MPNWNELPIEILILILRKVHTNRWGTKDLKQCALTCRNWRVTTRPLLFSFMRCASLEKFKNLMGILAKEPTVIKHVKIFHLDYPAIQLDLFAFEAIAKLFPNLEEIQFEKIRSNYVNFCKMVCNGGFPRLKKIPDPRNEDQNEWYLKCLEILKLQISHIKLDDNVTLERLKGRLDDFPNLKSIFTNLLYARSKSFVDYMESLTQKNKLLPVKEICINSIKVGERNLLTKLDDIQPLHNVSSLKINTYFVSRFIVSDIFMLYIMKKFPNLKKFDLLCEDEEIVDSDSYDDEDGNNRIIDEVSFTIDVAVRFFIYVSKIDISLVHAITTREKTACILESLCSSTFKTESLKYPLLEMDFNTVDDGNLPMVTLDASKINGDERVINVKFNGKESNSERRELDLLQLTGQYFNNIILNNVQYFHYFSLLEHIAKYCVHLETLSIKSGSRLRENLENKDLTPNHTVVKLELNNCILSSNLLSLISNVFPCLKSLSVIHFYQNRTLPRKNLTIEMSNISLKHLEFSIAFYYYSSPTEPTYIINGVCIKLHTDEKVKYFLFSFMDDNDNIDASMKRGGNGLNFTKYLTAYEFESNENDEQYLIITMQFKSIERLTIKYTSIDNSSRAIDYFF